MKKHLLLQFACASLCALGALLLSLTACGKSPSEASSETGAGAAVGAIFINSGADTELPEGNLYAKFQNNAYSYDLDAAFVYFFSPDEETTYAGNPNFTHMTFGANIDADTVGASGTISYHLLDGAENSVFAYYLYLDENGMYFDTAAPFATAKIENACTLTGEEYPCSVTVEAAEPVDHFSMLYYDADQNLLLSETDCSPEELIDYQRFNLDASVGSVEIVCCDAENNEMNKLSVTPDQPSAVICYENGRQILPSKALRFIWE